MSAAIIEVRKMSPSDSLEELWKLRREVFVIEQEVDESLEYEFEEESTHFAAFLANKLVGTARWRQTEKGIKLERFAVAKSARGKGVGAALVKAIVADIPSGFKVYLHAQAAAEGFYAKLGFVRDGDSFIEADILHYPMKLA
ncbi:MAG: GNAT family N-acetyltransferase [Bacteroidetes bacterium]|nr:MAG: GNAT family N-acetyltransferase [Bacteroidota bacterium]